MNSLGLAPVLVLECLRACLRCILFSLSTLDRLLSAILRWADVTTSPTHSQDKRSRNLLRGVTATSRLQSVCNVTLQCNVTTAMFYHILIIYIKCETLHVQFLPYANLLAYICMCVCVCVYIYTHECVSLCVSVCIERKYTHTHTHTHTHNAYKTRRILY